MKRTAFLFAALAALGLLIGSALHVPAVFAQSSKVAGVDVAVEPSERWFRRIGFLSSTGGCSTSLEEDSTGTLRLTNCTDAATLKNLTIDTLTATTINGDPTLATLTDGHVFIGDSSDVPTDTAISGDATLANDGTLTIRETFGKTATVSVSSNDLKACNATPKEIVAAPASGKAIVIDSLLFSMTRTSTAYTGGGAISFVYHGGSTATHAGSVPASVVTTGGAGVANNLLGPAVATNGTTVPSATAVDLSCATADFADGTGTAKVFVQYRIVTL